jgi:DNA polymerase-4
MSIRIMHVDLDAFFVEVCRRVHPELRDTGLLVVGGRRDSRGVVQSASYGARAFGVRSGMPVSQAVRLCPDATFVRGEFAEYRRASRAVRQELEQFAPIVVMTGLDEGYLDFSGTDLLHPVSLLDAADRVRTAVLSRTGLACSIGIGPNRMVAKLASDQAKPRGICEVRAGWERGFVAGLPLSALPGVGPKTAQRFADRGLTAVAQVQEMTVSELTTLVGREEALNLMRRAEGRGSMAVRPHGPPRSVSRETTFAQDRRDPRHLDRILMLLTARVAAQLREEGLRARAIVLKLRHGDFLTVTRRVTLPDATALDAELLGPARALLAPALADVRRRGQGVRLLGIAATQLLQAEAPDLFESAAHLRVRHVTAAVDAVRSRFGFDALRPGALMEPRREGGD